MTKKQKAQIIIDELEKLYPEVPVPLDHSDPFTLLVAVALSAQTTDKKVNQISPILFEVAGNPFTMKDLDVEEI
jgi:endonuclease-3